jgi:hypothetical protein
VNDKSSLFGKAKPNPEQTQSAEPAKEIGEKPEQVEEAAEKVESDEASAAFGKHGGDENEPLQTAEQVESLERQAQAHSEANLDAPKADHLNVASQAEAGADEPENKGKSIYSSGGIARFRLGKYQFENGQLSLDPEDAEKFEKLLATADARTQAQVVKIDIQAAEKASRLFQKGTRRTRGVDTAGNVL